MDRMTVSPEETEALGFEFAEGLKSGAVVGLYGELGAGKTCFVRGAARAFGVAEGVCSPSYTLINVHGGRRPFVHMDAFRLKGAEEMIAAGFEEYAGRDNVCFIEWADRIEPLLPKGAFRVRFAVLDVKRRRIWSE
jgi:tRNA threonylcarbamoyladenosine biosynthesis protein TsaE